MSEPESKGKKPSFQYPSIDEVIRRLAEMTTEERIRAIEEREKELDDLPCAVVFPVNE